MSPAAWLLLLQVGGVPADTQAAGAAMKEMSHHEHGPASNPHLRLTPVMAATSADSALARRIVSAIRGDLAKYRDVSSARADGYLQFLPNVPQPEYHFTNWKYGLEATFEFDPSRPTSLLYCKNADGSFTLTGVMFTAPARLSDDALGKRIPLGIARWHQHVNWCLPPKGEELRWKETRGGKPLFVPCWMVHVNAFASDDPAVIWGDHH